MNRIPLYAWPHIIEKEIERYTDKEKRETKITWLHNVIDYMYTEIPEGNDGNMYLAYNLSLALTYWYNSISYAKSMDSRRPKKDRETLKRSRKLFRKALNEVSTTICPIEPFISPLEVGK